MTIAELKKSGWIMFECISGSRAYGLELPTSDTDIKGVFVLPKEQFYGLEYIPQIANETNDEVYYELGRFIELLSKNNPNILELIATPEDKILQKHPLFDKILPNLFLSKKCKDSFGGYAFTQVRKAQGLNKKIVNPMEKEKKSILDFCYVLQGNGAVLLRKWLDSNVLQQENCGLVNVPHFKNVYAVYYDKQQQLDYKGIVRKEENTQVLLSSIPKSETPIAHLNFNQEGYVKYCKDYAAYWKWVANRNDARYQTNVAHGRNYDSKNMMHTFRLLDMAIEIMETGMVHVKRPNREELLKIRRGEFHYDELIQKAEEKMKQLEIAYVNSTLPDVPDLVSIEKLLVELRNAFYHDGC